MEKKFKPFDNVIVKSQTDEYWTCDLYSHFNEDSGTHETISRIDLNDNDILPYEGNEHLIGSDQNPDDEVRLEEGEYIIASDFIEGLQVLCGSLSRFIRIECESFLKTSYNCSPLPFKYCIRFKDFDPSNMEETKKKILCVKNGKIIRNKS